VAGKEKDRGAEVDFFGDSNVDWLTDDDERAAAARAAAASVPPPPPPSIRTATPLAGNLDDRAWANRVHPAGDPKLLSNQPTLIFSDVPTLPPMDSPLAPAASPPVVGTFDEAPLSDPDPSLTEAETVEVTHARALPATDAPTGPTETIQAAGPATLLLQTAAGEVAIRTGPSTDPGTDGEPASGVDTGGGDAPTEQAPRAAPPAPEPVDTVETVRVPLPPARPRLPARPPTPPPQSWQQVIALLSAERDAGDPADAGTCAWLAGSLSLRMATAPLEADRWFERAREAGVDTPSLHRQHAEARGALGRFSDQEQSLLALASVSDPVDRAEAWLEAGLVAWRRRERPDEAVRHFSKAAETLADDYTSRALLRALLPGLGRDTWPRRLDLLSEVAALAEGGIRADALVERAIVAEELGRHDECVGSLRGALDAEPGHTFAFQRLERALAADPSALADLRGREAQRWDQPDPGFWRWREAAARRGAGDLEGALGALDAAIAAGWRCEREREGLLRSLGRTDRVNELLAAELETRADPTIAFRLGVAREERGDLEGALAAYRRCVELDRGAFPASEAIARLARRSGKESVEGWREQLAVAPPDEARAVHLRIAELQIAAGAWADARGSLEALVASNEGSLERDVAFDLLDLVLCAEGGDGSALRALRRRRAEQTWDTGERVAWLLLAADHPGSADDGALALVEAALDARPDHPVALASLARFVVAGRVEAAVAAGRLRAAASSCEDPARKSALAYRAARAFADLGADGEARAFAEASIEGVTSVAGRWLVRGLSAGGASESAHQRAAAAAAGPDARPWALLAAAVWEPDRELARQDLDALLAERPDHTGAAQLLEALLWADGGGEALLDLYQNASSEDPADLVRNAVMLTEAGRTEEAVLVLRRLRAAPAGTPLRPAARIAVELGMADLAAEILAWSETAEDRTERARLLAGLGRAADALPLLVQLSASGPERIGVSARLATVAQQAGALDVMISAYATLAHEAQSASLRTAYGAWTAMQLHAAGRDRDALEPWRVALAERPTSTSALLGAARSLVARKDAEGLRRLFSMLRPEASELLVETLYLAGDRAGAADACWRAEVEGPRKLVNVLVVERLREELAASHGTASAWQGVYDALTRRRGLCRTPEGIDDADARRRWVLREKLASTDAAWDLYRSLHEQSPDDAEVTEALARIAGARGDLGTAVKYLDQLASTAPDRESAARYRRRIGEAQEQAGQVEAARQAYFDALDHVPDDADALGALRRIAEASGDWSAVVTILQRQVATAPPARQLALRREVAQVTEAHAGDALVAMDAWRAVLEQAPDDADALDRLVALAEARGQWGVFVDAGQARVRGLSGPARTELLRRIGIACLDHLGREEGVRFLQEAASGEVPDLAAVVRLEQHARVRSDWPVVVRMLELQARLHPGRRDRVDALQKAARLQHDALHAPDEAAATYQQILGLDQDHEPALRYLAGWLFEQGRIAEALPVCARLEPLVEQGQDLDDFDTRMELANFWYYHGEILRRSGREDESTSRYARALELNASHVASLEAVGPLYVAAADWARAEGVYKQLLQLTAGQGDKARLAGIYAQLGLVERELGQQEKAYKRFGKALELQPNHVAALKGMALVLEDREDWSNLLNVYNNVIYHATQPEDVIDAYMTKGRVLDDQMQRQDKAAQHYQRSLDFDPAQPHAYLRLAELAMRRDAYQEAGDLVDRAFALDQDLVDPWRARLLIVRAVAWQDAGRGPEAERCLREARMRDPDLVARLGEPPLGELENVRRALKESFPKGRE
jgi:tetratricopeptide (TPR) repeat protein